MDSAEHYELAQEMASYIRSPHSRRQFLKGVGVIGASIPLASWAAETVGGVSAAGAATNKVTRAGYFFDSLADEWYIDEVNGAKHALAALSVPMQTYTFGTDPSAQIGEVETAVSAGTQIMAIYAPLGQGLTEIYKTVSGAKGFFDLEADIPPWTYPGSYGPAFTAYVTADTSPGAELSADTLFKKLGGQPKVVWMQAISGGQDNNQSYLGFKAALAKNPQVKLLATGDGQYAEQPAFNLMASWLSQYPEIDVVLSHADTMSLGVYSAMKQAGRTNIKIASVNGQKPGLQAVKEGHFESTVFKGPLLTGAWRMVHLFDVANGLKLQPLERMFWFGTFIVTQQNVDKALALYEQSSLPYNWKKMSRTLHPTDWEMQMPMMPVNPVSFWKASNLGKAEPANWLPADVHTSINEGGFEKLVALYKAHIGHNPLGSYKVVMQPEYGL